MKVSPERQGDNSFSELTETRTASPGSPRQGAAGRGSARGSAPAAPPPLKRQPTLAHVASHIATSFIKPSTREREERVEMQKKRLRRQQTKALLKQQASLKASESGVSRPRLWLTELTRWNKSKGRKTVLKLLPDGGTEEVEVDDDDDDEYLPVFMLVTALIYLIIGAILIWYNGGLEPFAVNPFFGPTERTLIYFGAKYAPLMVEKQQHWRFVTAMWLHVGIIHFVLYMIAQYRNGLPLEREIGHWRAALVYFISAIGGTLLSVLMIPDLVSVGPSGALMGVLGISMVDVLQSWDYREDPRKEMVSIVVTLVIALVLGLLPSIDNFAHVGGFVCGILSGMVFSPQIHFKLRKTFVVVLGALLLVAYFGAGFAIYFARISPTTQWCSVCTTIECLPILDWCKVDPSTLF